MAATHFFGGEFFGGEFFFGAAPVGPTATPGFPTRGRVRDLDERPRYETEAEKLARRIAEGTIRAPVELPETAPVADEYRAKSARIVAAISAARADAEASRQAIAAIEAEMTRREAEWLRGNLLRAQQALQLALVQEAVMLEEMEVLDVAFVATVALGVVMQ